MYSQLSGLPPLALLLSFCDAYQGILCCREIALDRTACLASGGMGKNNFKKSGQGHKSGVSQILTLRKYLIIKLQGLVTSHVFVTESI